MSQIKLELHLDEVNMVLGALGQLPFVQVAGLVDKIKEQATPQIPVPEMGAVEVVEEPTVQ
jgi:hypothetical protein